jgi:hypothetical protein
MMTTIFNNARLVFTAVLGLFLYTGVASADSIGPICDTCQGSIYTLYYSGVPIADPVADPNPAAHETFRITLTIDTSGYNAGGLYVDSAAIKVSSTLSNVASSLFAASGGLANWNLVIGGMNGSGGCKAGTNGYDCADWVGPGFGVPVAPGTLLAFTFDQTVDNGTLDTSLNGAHIKTRYLDANGNQIGPMVSEDITLQLGTSPLTGVPEPSTSLLLGAGLAAVSFFARSRLGHH